MDIGQATSKSVTFVYKFLSLCSDASFTVFLFLILLVIPGYMTPPLIIGVLIYECGSFCYHASECCICLSQIDCLQ